jgi:ABC-2 type transport system permease protein
MKIYKRLSYRIILGAGVALIFLVGIGSMIAGQAMEKMFAPGDDVGYYQFEQEDLAYSLQEPELTPEVRRQYQALLGLYDFLTEKKIKPDSWQAYLASRLYGLAGDSTADDGSAPVHGISGALEQIVQSVTAGQREEATNASIQLFQNLSETAPDAQTRDVRLTEARLMGLWRDYYQDIQQNGWIAWQVENIRSLEETRLSVLYWDSEEALWEAGFTGNPSESLPALEESIAIANVQLEKGLVPWDYPESQWAYQKGLLSGLAGILGILCVIIAGNMVAGEFQEGTIKLLMIRPYPRWEVLLSKYLATFLFAMALLAAVAVAALFAGGIVYGFSPPPVYIRMEDGAFVQSSWLPWMLIDFLLISVKPLMFTAVGLLFSVLFRNTGLSIGLSLVLLYLGPVVNWLLEISSGSRLVRYTMFSNWNLAIPSYSDGMGSGAAPDYGFSLAVLAVHFAGMALLAFLVFQRRDIKT